MISEGDLMAKLRSRKTRLGGVLISRKEGDLLGEFGNTSRGYNIECRFCGWKSVFHDEEAAQRFEPEKSKEHEPGSDVRLKGYRTTLQICANNIGYVPANIREWMCAAREDDG